MVSAYLSPYIGSLGPLSSTYSLSLLIPYSRILYQVTLVSLTLNPYLCLRSEIVYLPSTRAFWVWNPVLHLGTTPSSYALSLNWSCSMARLTTDFLKFNVCLDLYLPTWWDACLLSGTRFPNIPSPYCMNCTTHCLSAVCL